jgi:hypothetical protein
MKEVLEFVAFVFGHLVPRKTTLLDILNDTGACTRVEVKAFVRDGPDTELVWKWASHPRVGQLSQVESKRIVALSCRVTWVWLTLYW